jgi:hypothetical protein
MGVPYFVVIEPQDYDAYFCSFDPETILVAPFSNHGDGPGRARNWCWDHAKAAGFKRHWVMDDNINGFVRLHENEKIPVADGGMIRAAEDFVDRFENVPLAGLNYRFFAANKSFKPPFLLNTRIYSCLLIENDCPYRWRGRYNEDTILALDVLLDKKRPDQASTPPRFVTMQFNTLLQNKTVTQQLGGGNTEEFYSHEGTSNKSMMLKSQYPELVALVEKYQRDHHHINYKKIFGSNQPVLKSNLPAPKSYEMELVPVPDRIRK